jgi:nucleotide-binding universal stress UspA family protein
MALMRLEALVPDSTRLSQRPVTRLSNGKPHVQILEVAREKGSDLIVIGVHGEIRWT